MANGRPTVLVVDDEPEIAELMRDFLQADGFAVEIAHDGAAALAALGRVAADCVLLDIMMPGQSGFETLRQIRERSAPPVLILNMFYSGLGIARQMYGRGVRVVGISAHRQIYGNFTRLCQVRRVPNSQEHPKELAEYLLRAAPEL